VSETDSKVCDVCETRIQQAVHDLHLERHSDGGRGCAECRADVVIVARALADAEHTAPVALTEVPG
jgi:hypothetical protein